MVLQAAIAANFLRHGELILVTDIVKLIVVLNITPISGPLSVWGVCGYQVQRCLRRALRTFLIDFD
jgi:hypothetical protein